MTAPDWTVMDPTPEPDPMPVCPTGITGHQWNLTIEEGQPGLTLANGEVCPEVEYHDVTSGVCQHELHAYFQPEDYEMESISVELEVRVEKGGYPEEVSCVVLDIIPQVGGLDVKRP